MEDRVSAGRKMVAKALLITLSENLKQRNHHHLAARVVETIPNEVGVGEISVRDSVFKTEKTGQLELRFRASLVPKGYKADVKIPNGYEKTARDMFRVFTAAMECYWTEWCSNNPALYKIICTALVKDETQVPFALSVPEDINSAMSARYWFADDANWIGVIAYYVGSDGRIYTSS